MSRVLELDYILLRANFFIHILEFLLNELIPSKKIRTFTTNTMLSYLNVRWTFLKNTNFQLTIN